MPVYRVCATERVFEETFIRAKSIKEAIKIAQEDWRVGWETVDGEEFEIDGVEEIPVEEEKFVKISPVMGERENKMYGMKIKEGSVIFSLMI